MPLSHIPRYSKKIGYSLKPFYISKLLPKMDDPGVHHMTLAKYVCTTIEHFLSSDDEHITTAHTPQRGNARNRDLLAHHLRMVSSLFIFLSVFVGILNFSTTWKKKFFWIFWNDSEYFGMYFGIFLNYLEYILEYFGIKPKSINTDRTFYWIYKPIIFNNGYVQMKKLCIMQWNIAEKKYLCIPCSNKHNVKPRLEAHPLSIAGWSEKEEFPHTYSSASTPVLG